MIYWFFALLAIAIAATVLAYVGVPQGTNGLTRQIALVTLALALVAYFGMRRRNAP